VCTAPNAVAPLEFGQRAEVRQTKGRPALAGVHRSHSATGTINGIDIDVPHLQILHNAKKQNDNQMVNSLMTFCKGPFSSTKVMRQMGMMVNYVSERI
jgi:hypothetical protein